MPVTLEDLTSLLAERRAEGLHLEFKRGDALARSNQARAELVKDITGFANGDGGTIWYGIEEGQEEGVAVAVGLAPVTDPTFTPEWIAQVLRSNSSPPLQRIEIIELPVQGGRVLAVEIESSYTAHQSVLDRRYHQRGARTTEAMLDFQIRDVMARRSKPHAEVVPSFATLNQGPDLHRYLLDLRISNVGSVSLHNWWLEVDLPARCVRDTRLGPNAVIAGNLAYQQIVREYSGFKRISCGDPGVVSGRRLILHPGQMLVLDRNHRDFCEIIIEVDHAAFAALHGRPEGACEARLYCEGAQPVIKTIPFQDWSRF